LTPPAALLGCLADSIWPIHILCVLLPMPLSP